MMVYGERGVLESYARYDGGRATCITTHQGYHDRTIYYNNIITYLRHTGTKCSTEYIPQSVLQP